MDIREGKGGKRQMSLAKLQRNRRTGEGQKQRGGPLAGTRNCKNVEKKGEGNWERGRRKTVGILFGRDGVKGRLQRQVNKKHFCGLWGRERGKFSWEMSGGKKWCLVAQPIGYTHVPVLTDRGVLKIGQTLESHLSLKNSTKNGFR